jgi:hypothetical protein
MKNHRRKWRMALAGLALGLLGCSAQRALAGDPCVYEGTKYSDGAAACQAGMQFRCMDGEWTSLRSVCRDEIAVNKSCDFAGVSYSTGSASCQAGTQFRCDAGTWRSLAVPCSAGDAPLRLVPDGRTCMFNDATVGNNSTICKAGTTFLCSNGEWINLGTICR